MTARFRILLMMLFPLLTVFACREVRSYRVAEVKIAVPGPVPVTGGRVDPAFMAVLELMYPFQCHDTVFLQDRLILERMDLANPVTKEFPVKPGGFSALPGMENPDKRVALVEAMLCQGDQSFERQPGGDFVLSRSWNRQKAYRAIGRSLQNLRRGTLVYLIGPDTAKKVFSGPALQKEIFHDPAKLNCRIVSDLRTIPGEERSTTRVLILYVPPDRVPGYSSGSSALPGEVWYAGDFPGRAGGSGPCPPDSMIRALNVDRMEIIREFSNYLYYISTTRDDDGLKARYGREAADLLTRIPGFRTEGIPGNDLRQFLGSSFRQGTTADPLIDPCGLICGIRIDPK